MSGMSGHESHAVQTTTWLTPIEIVRSLGHFDLDPCGFPGWPTADHLICLPEDGLTTPWNGRVWLNPPYGSEAWVWLDKLAAHGTGTALIFARTETHGFVEQVWGKASAVKFLHGRLRFYRPDGTRAERNAGAPSVLVDYGDKDAELLKASDTPGTFLPI